MASWKKKQGQQHRVVKLVKAFNSEVTLTKLHVSDCGGTKDTTQYTETKKGLVSYCQWSSDIGGNVIVKSITDHQSRSCGCCRGGCLHGGRELHICPRSESMVRQILYCGEVKE